MHVRGSALDCDSPCVTAVLAPTPLPLVLAEAAADAVLAIARPGDYVSAHVDCDSPLGENKSDMKLGPQMHLGAESQSWGTIQLVPKSWKMARIIPLRRGGT